MKEEVRPPKKMSTGFPQKRDDAKSKGLEQARRTMKSGSGETDRRWVRYRDGEQLGPEYFLG